VKLHSLPGNFGRDFMSHYLPMQINSFFFQNSLKLFYPKWSQNILFQKNYKYNELKFSFISLFNLQNQHKRMKKYIK
jgi:hypothetical protein